MKYLHNGEYFPKIDAEVFDAAYTFTNDLSSGETLQTCNASIFDSDGNDKTASMLSATSVSSPTFTFTIIDGTAGQTYEIKIKGTSDVSKLYIHYVNCEVFGGITLNTKVADAEANSYVTLKEANEYIMNKYGHTSLWDTLTQEGKKRVLIEAADDMEQYNYIEEKYYDAQRLQFPRSNHETIEGDVSTPCTINSFADDDLYSSDYMEVPANYWKYGACHITAGTPIRDVRVIDTSTVTGTITMAENFTATPTENTDFIVFAPIEKEIKDAQCEQALYILRNTSIETLQEYKQLGARRVEIGDVSVWFSEGKFAGGKGPTVSTQARRLLSRWIKRKLRVLRA